MLKRCPGAPSGRVGGWRLIRGWQAGGREGAWEGEEQRARGRHGQARRGRLTPSQEANSGQEAVAPLRTPQGWPGLGGISEGLWKETERKETAQPEAPRERERGAQASPLQNNPAAGTRGPGLWAGLGWHPRDGHFSGQSGRASKHPKKPHAAFSPNKFSFQPLQGFSGGGGLDFNNFNVCFNLLASQRKATAPQNNLGKVKLQERGGKLPPTDENPFWGDTYSCIGNV